MVICYAGYGISRKFLHICFGCLFTTHFTNGVLFFCVYLFFMMMINCSFSLNIFPWEFEVSVEDKFLQAGLCLLLPAPGGHC